jgi:hypothetical protein
MAEEEDYETTQARLEEANQKILAGFINHTVGVRKKGKMKMHKVGEHLRFFANEYLLNYESLNLLEGLESFPGFVGDWFIRKCMWSDEASVSENITAFDTFLTYLDETDQITKERLSDLRETLKKERPIYLLRAEFYNNPEVELEDIRDEFGMWDDKAIRALQDEIQRPPLSPGEGRLTLNLLFSGNAAKFLKLKSPELIKLKDWVQTWDDPSHHWISNWRCEDCFGMKGTKERILILTNDASRFSFLVRIAAGDIKALFETLNGKLMSALEATGVHHPTQAQVHISTLSGAARGITGFQNNMRLHLDHITESGKFKFLEDLEDRINHLPTSTLDYEYPRDAFARLSKDDPPFPDDYEENNIVPFLS